MCQVYCYRTPLADRFWARVAKDGPNGCWRWLGSRNGDGRPTIGAGGKTGRGAKTLRPHRVSWELVNGPIPDGLVVCHKCDNPPCTNPDHLFLGTQGDNMRDCFAKGRRGIYPRAGENNGNAKLTWEEVREIRSLYVRGQISQTTIANRFNVPQTTISGIISGRKWIEEV